MSAPPCKCPECEEAYADLRRAREASRVRMLEAHLAEIPERLRLGAIQLGAAFRVLPYQLSAPFRKARK